MMRISTACFLLLAFCVNVSAKPFTFVALGDTAYTDDSYASYKALIGSINRVQPAFSIHVGDTKGYQPCNDETQARVAAFFNLFEQALFYTPGDNEWTDCHADKPEAAATLKIDTLSAIRKAFFSQSKSLGQQSLPLTRQTDISANSTSPENAYWLFENVLFATVHVVGSNDGFGTGQAILEKEAKSRRQANLAWLATVEQVAKQKKAKALVLALHAELFERGANKGRKNDAAMLKTRKGVDGPYHQLVQQISNLAQSYGGPMLLIHGDHHRFLIDRPFFIGGKYQRGENVTRLQVYGHPDLKAVSITVDTQTPWVFGFSPLYP